MIASAFAPVAPAGARLAFGATLFGAASWLPSSVSSLSPRVSRRRIIVPRRRERVSGRDDVHRIGSIGRSDRFRLRHDTAHGYARPVTLIVTAITNHGIVHASDSNLTADEGRVLAGRGTKVFRLGFTEAAVSVAGAFSVARERMDKWMPDAITAYAAQGAP